MKWSLSGSLLYIQLLVYKASSSKGPLLRIYIKFNYPSQDLLQAVWPFYWPPLPLRDRPGAQGRPHFYMSCPGLKLLVTPDILRKALHNMRGGPIDPSMQLAILIISIGFLRQSSLAPPTKSAYDPLLPGRPPSWTYLTLGVMLEPYVRPVV